VKLKKLQKIKETKSWFFEKINIIDKLRKKGLKLKSEMK